ncbi:hypothetical protein Bbelb_296740 [Branchiostoma belcheri]|nr:hypothetical protein Bbelb_296740 [Branchiostoma belcheri]
MFGSARVSSSKLKHLTPLTPAFPWRYMGGNRAEVTLIIEQTFSTQNGIPGTGFRPPFVIGILPKDYAAPRSMPCMRWKLWKTGGWELRCLDLEKVLGDGSGR